MASCSAYPIPIFQSSDDPCSILNQWESYSSGGGGGDGSGSGGDGSGSGCGGSTASSSGGIV